MSELELIIKIKEATQQLRELRDSLGALKIKKPHFLHKCPLCKAEWYGWKETIKECTYCKRKIAPEELVIPNEELCKMACAKLDDEIRKTGRVSKKSGRGEYIFMMNGEQMEYIELLDGIERLRRNLLSSHDELGKWQAWDLFFKEEVVIQGMT